MDKSITRIVEYFVLWAVIHSALASLTVKGWAQRIFGRGVMRWYRLGFVIFALASFAPLLLMVGWLPDRQLYDVTGLWRVLMTIGRLSALVALGIATLQAGLWHFVGLAQIAADDPLKTGAMQVRGFFRYVRHPLYLFSTLLLWLSPSMTANQLTLNLLIMLYFVIGSIHEEQLLVDEYGAAYEEYRRQVPRFIPWPGRVYRENANV